MEGLTRPDTRLIGREPHHPDRRQKDRLEAVFLCVEPTGVPGGQKAERNYCAADNCTGSRSSLTTGPSFPGSRLPPDTVGKRLLEIHWKFTAGGDHDGVAGDIISRRGVVIIGATLVIVAILVVWRDVFVAFKFPAGHNKPLAKRDLLVNYVVGDWPGVGGRASIGLQLLGSGAHGDRRPRAVEAHCAIGGVSVRH